MRFYDRKNEIATLQENERNPQKISMTKLEEKISNLPKDSFGKYNFTVMGLSLNDM